jgi:heme A synthase
MARRLALGTLVSTWLLLVIGGAVNPMGASMACPDWYFVPTCNGEVFPEMTGGVLYEHGHRLWATWVGMMTLALCVTLLASRSVALRTRVAGVVALVLVAVQGTLGGITVLLNLHPAVSTVHLGTAMVFFSLLVWLTLRLWAVPHVDRPESTLAVGRRTLTWVAAAGVYAQILLGGLTRHLGAGLICGDDWVLCGPDMAWTAQPLAHLHMTHRAVGLLLLPLVIAAAVQLRAQGRATGRTTASAIAPWVGGLVALQVVLGFVTVATGRSVPVVTAHTAVAALVLAGLVAGALVLGREGNRLHPRRAGLAG